MSSELSLDVLLNAINAVKAEVAGLASSLRSAEDRIARLEIAAYTPLVSPEISPGDVQQTLCHELSKRDNLSEITQHDTNSRAGNEQQSALLAKPCSAELPCHIRRHLLPVNDSIAAFTSHLLRIERAIGRSNSNHSSDSSETSFHAPHPEDRKVSSQQEPKQHASPKGQATSPSNSPKLQNHRELNGLDISTAASRPVFGQISTPRRPDVSLNVAGSPFGNYVDERSPFS